MSFSNIKLDSLNLDSVNDKSFVDMPAAKPAVGFPLQRVGVTNRPHYIRILDPFDSRERDLWVDIKVFFELPANRRGVHMSRIEDALNNLREKAPHSFSEYPSLLIAELVNRQELVGCELDIVANYERVIGKNPSGRESTEILKLHSNITSRESTRVSSVGVSVPFINACPCTQRWAIRDFYNALTATGRTQDEIALLLESAPRQAHTNRGEATLLVESENVSHVEIYEVLDRSVPIIRELLKGMDEHDVVTRAHKQGMFCEDNIRLIVSEVVNTFSCKLSDQTKIKIAVEVDESVHFHNLRAEVCDTLGALAEGIVK